jgi:hypothetical protein
MENFNQSELKKKFRISPALALWFLAPIFGELFSGSAPLNEYINPLMIILFGMLYGSGAILIREFVIRRKKGWISMFLLGMAFGIFEEGLMVRSFFNPDWMDLDVLGVYGRVWGMNWVWAEHLTIYHALISIMASIVFIEMLYPRQRKESWIGKRGMVFNIAAFLLTLPIGYALMPYDVPIYWLAFCWILMGTLALLAWIVPASLPEPKETRVPRPRRFWWIGSVGMFLYFILVYTVAELGIMHFVLAMVLQFFYYLFMLWLILRWSGNAHQWDDRHRMALIIGAECFFLVFGPLTTGSLYPVMYFSNPVFLLLLWLAYRKVNKRVKWEKMIIEDVQKDPNGLIQ